MRLPFFSSSDRRGEGGGVAFWAKSLFCGESSTRAARPPSLGPGPGASVAGRNTPTPWAWRRQQRISQSAWHSETQYLNHFLPDGAGVAKNTIMCGDLFPSTHNETKNKLEVQKGTIVESTDDFNQENTV